MVWTIVEKKGTWVNINTAINYLKIKKPFLKLSERFVRSIYIIT